MNQPVFAVAGISGTDYSGKSGYAVKYGATGPAVCTAATDLPAGVIVDVNAADNTLSIALPGATVPVKVTGAVKRFQRGYLTADGSVSAEAGASGEVAICQFLADGATGELVNALILAPVKRA